jgi:hypothetical protein
VRDAVRFGTDAIGGATARCDGTLASLLAAQQVIACRTLTTIAVRRGNRGTLGVLGGVLVLLLVVGLIWWAVGERHGTSTTTLTPSSAPTTLPSRAQTPAGDPRR